MIIDMDTKYYLDRAIFYDIIQLDFEEENFLSNILEDIYLHDIKTTQLTKEDKKFLIKIYNNIIKTCEKTIKTMGLETDIKNTHIKKLYRKIKQKLVLVKKLEIYEP